MSVGGGASAITFSTAAYPVAAVAPPTPDSGLALDEDNDAALDARGDDIAEAPPPAASGGCILAVNRHVSGLVGDEELPVA